MVSMSFFMLLNILIIITLNSQFDKLLASISSSSSGEFSCSFIWGLFLCLPIWLLLCISTLVVKLISDRASNCNQQPGLSPTEWERVTPAGGALASPQADATLETSALPEKEGFCCMGNDSAQGSWQLFLQFSPWKHQPQTPLKHL